MKRQTLILKVVLIIGVVLLSGVSSYAQTLDNAIAVIDEQGLLRVIQFNFDDSIEPANILDVNVFSLDGNESLIIGKPRLVPDKGNTRTIYEVSSATPLKIAKLENGTRVLNEYIIAVKIKTGDKEVWQNTKIILPDPTKPDSAITKDESDDIEDSAFYIDGEMNGAYKKKTSFSTNIKVKRLTQRKGWIYSTSPFSSTRVPFPYFKLNASTDVEADPDSMQIGFNFARIVRTHFYWDNDVKLESQRDFKNTNFIYAARVCWRPAGKALTKNEGDNSTLFFRPFIGAEVGKNLRSPLDAAEGDGIARILAGAELRLNVPMNLEKGQEINWTNSYTRRWLLTDELGFEADDDGNLQLVRFGKSPRDYFNSKAEFGFNKFFGAFVEYEWGQLPPSYKFVNHRFRVGLFYRFKFSVK